MKQKSPPNTSLTINVDASLNLNDNIGSFGYWISSDYGRWTGGEIFRDTPKDSNEAEMKGVINALHITFNKLKESNINTIETIFINCDSDVAKNVFESNGNIKSISNKIKKYKYLYEIYNNILVKNKFHNIKFLKIKGHSRNSNSRNYVNNWCDKYAGKLIRKYLTT